MNEGDRQAALAAFEAFRSGLGGDRDALERFIGMMADDAIVYFPSTPNTKPPFVGRDAIREFFFGTVVKVYDSGLRISPVFHLEDESRMAFLFADEGTMSSGREYANSVCVTLEIRDGKIQRYWEFFGQAGYFVQDLGTG